MKKREVDKIIDVKIKMKHLLKVLAGLSFLMLFGLSLKAQIIPPNVPQAGLVAWYPFNGNANDESVNNNNGVVTGATLTTDRFGNPNSAYLFDGQNDFIEVPWPHEFYFNANESFTLNVWIRPDSLDSSLPHGQSQRIFWKYSCPYSSVLDELGIQFTDGPIFRNRSAGHNVGIYAGLQNLCESWFMLTYIKDAANDSLFAYIDGVRVNSSSIPSFAHNHQIPFEFGAAKFCGGGINLQPVYFFKGKIDDGAIWNRALAKNEIEALYDYNFELEIDLSPDISTLCQGDSLLAFHNDTSDNPNLSWEIITPSNNIVQSNSDTFLLTGLTFGNYQVFLKSHDTVCLDTVFAIDSVNCKCLVGDYQFLGNADDLSGNNNNGNPIGVIPVAGQAGQPNTAYRFTGNNNSYIEVNNNQPIIQNDEFTIIALAKKLGPGGGVDGRQPIFSQRNDAVQAATQSKINFFIEVPGDLIRCNLRKSTTGADDLVTYPAPMDTNWHCYAVTLDSLDTLRLYLDGIEVNSVQINQTGDFSTAIDYTQIGRHSYGGDPHRSYFNGAIDFVEVYDCFVDPTQACAVVKCEGFDFTLSVDSLPSAGCDSFLVSVDSVLYGTPPVRYDWSSGDSTQQVLLTPGTYSVTVFDSLGCSKADTFEVIGRSINLDLDSSFFCIFDSILVRTTDTSGVYAKSWSVTTPDSVFNFQGDSLPMLLNTPGIYRFEIAYGDSSCTDSLIREFTVDSVPQIVFLPGDSFYCEFDTLWVDTSLLGDFSFAWSTGDSGFYTLVQDTGFLAVTATSVNGCRYVDSTYIHEIEPFNLNLPADTFLCAGDILILTIPGFFDSVLWNDGDTNLIKNIDTSGLFTAEASNSCGTLVDSIKVDYVIPPQSLSLNDTVICSVDSFVIELESQPGDSILWQDSTNSVVKVFYESGVYGVNIDNRCGSETETFRLTFADTPVVYIDDDLELCEQEEIYRVEIFLENDFEYIWSTGAGGSQITITDSGFYTVTVIDDSGCEGVFGFDVGLCPFEVFLPNVITPNGDGVNDRFVVKGLRGKEFNLLIYNRWGILLFDNNGFAQEWDGTVNGKSASAGTYFYILEYTNEINNQREVKKGSFMLLTD